MKNKTAKKNSMSKYSQTWFYRAFWSCINMYESYSQLFKTIERGSSYAVNELVSEKVIYHTRATASCAYQSKKHFSAPIFSHKKVIKSAFQLDILGGWLIIESGLQWREYGYPRLLSRHSVSSGTDWKKLLILFYV